MSLYVAIVDRGFVRLWNYFELRPKPLPSEIPIETTTKLWVMKMQDRLPGSGKLHPRWIAHESPMCYENITAAILLPGCIGYATPDSHGYYYDGPYGCYSIRFNVFPVPVCVCEKFVQPRSALERLATI